MFQKTKYIREDGKFRPLDFPTSHSFSHYLNCKGFSTDMEAEAAKQLYGRNRWVWLERSYSYMDYIMYSTS